MEFSPRIAAAFKVALGVLIALQTAFLLMATFLLPGVRSVPIILGTGIVVDVLALLVVIRASRRFRNQPHGMRRS